eukprot:161998-Amphidinium_carterae.1
MATAMYVTLMALEVIHHLGPVAIWYSDLRNTNVCLPIKDKSSLQLTALWLWMMSSNSSPHSASIA